MEITNVDEQGRQIDNINLDDWERTRTEEVHDEHGRLTGIISHCRKITELEIKQRSIHEAQINLKATDYISTKVMDSLLLCENIADILKLLADFKNEYGEVIEQRKAWRKTINDLES